LAEGITCWEPQITEPMESIPEIEAKEEPESGSSVLLLPLNIWWKRVFQDIFQMALKP